MIDKSDKDVVTIDWGLVPTLVSICRKIYSFSRMLGMKHINKLCIKFCQTLGLVLLLVPILCTAEIVSIGPHQIYMPMPIGDCTLQESNPKHNKHITLMSEALAQVDNTFLLQSTDCEILKNWDRMAHSLPPDTAMVSIVSDFVDEKILLDAEEYAVFMRQELINIGAEEFGDILDEGNAVANKLAEKHSLAVRMDKPTYLGVVGHDKNAAYTGILRQVTLKNRLKMNQLTLTAFTLVNGKMIQLNLVRKYNDGELPKSIRQTLTEIKRWVARVQSAN